MEGSLTVCPLGLHDLGVGGGQFLQLFQAAEAGGGMRVQCRAAFDQKVHQIFVALVEYAHAAGPEMASGMNPGAGFEQHVNGFAVSALNGGEKGRHTGAGMAIGSSKCAFSSGLR